MSRPPLPKSQRTTNPIAIRLFPEQRRKLRATANKLRLSQQSALRQAIEFGLPALESALTPQP